ncbi:hypothetical protein K435DRAFT_577193, partial [Dendrothele bispora CBS 962.96]
YQLSGITMDNASVNDTTMTEFEDELEMMDIEFDHTRNRISSTVSNALRNGAINKIRTAIRQIRLSSLRRERFSQLVQENNGNRLQLLRDVDTRWSSTHMMLERALHLREVIQRFLSDVNFQLQEYSLSSVEWKAVDQLSQVLEVPHAFQQLLSAEKTPTLCDVIPSFEEMIHLWQDMKTRLPDMRTIIDAGIRKLEEYRNKMVDVPAYTLAMIIHPEMKLNWFYQH